MILLVSQNSTSSFLFFPIPVRFLSNFKADIVDPSCFSKFCVILLVFQNSARFLSNFKAGIAVFYPCINIDFLLGQVTNMTSSSTCFIAKFCDYSIPRFGILLVPALSNRAVFWACCSCVCFPVKLNSALITSLLAWYLLGLHEHWCTLSCFQ